MYGVLLFKLIFITLLYYFFFFPAYYFGLVLFSQQSDHSYWPPWQLGFYWKLYLVSSLILGWLSLTLIFYWSRKNWSKHPIAHILHHHAQANTSWQAVASDIDVEFRRIDKFTTGAHGRRLIVTDSWLMMTSTYFVHIAHQSDIHLTLVASQEHELSHESNVGVQYLTIQVISVNQQVQPFTIRLVNCCNLST